MRISNVPAIFFVSFLVSGILYFPTAEAKLVFDFVDFIRSYHETGWNIYDSATHHLSPYWVSKVAVTSLYLLFGFAAQPWHWVSCFLLAANVSLFFAWLRNLLLFVGSKQAHTIAAYAALLFILVPYHTETLVWAGAFNYLIVGLFVWSGLYSTERFLTTSNRWWAVVAFFSFLLGSFSHEWGLFGIAAAFLLWLLMQPASELRSKKTGFFLLSAVSVVALYLLNQCLSGRLIAHYGAEVHLHFQWRDMVAMFYKYGCKIVLLSGFWPVSVQEKVFAYFLVPAVNKALLGLLLLLLAVSCYQLLFKKNTASIGWFLFLLYALFVFPVLNLYFPNWTKIMADRYCFLPAAFLLSALVVFLFSVNGLKWLLWPYAALMFFLLQTDIASWQRAGSLLTSLEKDFRWNQNERIFFLNMPDNFNGAYMLRSTFTSGVAARAIKNGHYYPRQNNMTDVASYNLFNPEDSVLVQVLDSNRLRVQLSNPAAWWWKNGAGCESYRTEQVKLDLDIYTQSYTATFLHKNPQDVFLYQANGHWVEVPGF
ncbi:MAG: hypothetical protein IPN22_14735 [Bacteroidetes bacterium]|nr:hypothetical protein [Bacteroidota bacterium]